MLRRAAAAQGIDLGKSFLIGDRWRDVDCAHAAGCRAIFIDHGYREALREKPEVTVSTFEQAVQAVLRNATA
jgi:D-glycero-D-manno-heptose 1,7-bisphosphate phosphatase